MSLCGSVLLLCAAVCGSLELRWLYGALCYSMSPSGRRTLTLWPSHAQPLAVAPFGRYLHHPDLASSPTGHCMATLYFLHSHCGPLHAQPLAVAPFGRYLHHPDLASSPAGHYMATLYFLHCHPWAVACSSSGRCKRHHPVSVVWLCAMHCAVLSDDEGPASLHWLMDGGWRIMDGGWVVTDGGGGDRSRLQLQEGSRFPWCGCGPVWNVGCRAVQGCEGQKIRMSHVALCAWQLCCPSRANS